MNTQDNRPFLFKLLDLFPLFFLMLLIYNIVMLFPGDTNALMQKDLFSIPLVSGAEWNLQVGHLFIVIGLAFLFVELLKSTKTTTTATVEHVFSLIVFIVFFLEFLLVKEAGNSVFFILMLMSLLDVMAGFSITIATARRDVNIPPFGGN